MNSMRGLQPWLQPAAEWLVYVAGLNGLQPRVTSVYRSYAQQKRLYDRWRSGLNPYPAAPPGRSKHEHGLAFDMVVNAEWGQRALGALWQRMGGRWGGAVDPVHFEAP